MNKAPWEEFPEIWNTKYKFMSWLRGGIRRGLWNRSPIKLEVIKRKRKRIISPKTGKEVWGGECYICGDDFVQSELQVDHVKGEHTLKDIGDIQSFIEAMTCLSLDDLDLVCKACHKNKSYAERYGITIEQAEKEKMVIEFGKLNTGEQNKCLKTLLINPPKTAKARKDAYREYLNYKK